MTNSNDDRDNDTLPPRKVVDEFPKPPRYLPSLFDSLWSLPSTIYQRGNEHGREFGRLFDEQRHEREEEQEREDGRGSRACGWRGRERHQERPVADGMDAKGGEEEKDLGDWVNRVVKELERGEKEAQDLYDQWLSRVEGNTEGGDKKDKRRQRVFSGYGEVVEAGTLFPASNARQLQDRRQISEHDCPIATTGDNPSWQQKDYERGRKTENCPSRHQRQHKQDERHEDAAWSAIFPAWSNTPPSSSSENDNNTTTNPHEHVYTRDPKNRPLTRTASGIEDTLDKLHQDLEHWMGTTSQWSQFLHNGYMRDSRLWEDEGLFGSSLPFSRPLSTIFSLGMRPFVPQDSAMAYLLYSEYSPLHLEHETGFDASFRRRFEDLVRVQAGSEMSGNDGEEKVGTKVEWIGRIVPLLKEGDGVTKGRISIGSAGDRQPVLQVEEVHKASPTSTAEATEQQAQVYDGPDAELDMYEHHFSGRPTTSVEHLAQTPLHTQTHSTASSSSSLSSSSNILSTLTTTERHTSSDGTITTKTVLKKRFADGREESSETIETSPSAWASARQQKFSSLAQREQESKIAREAKGSKGWFWSS
jgi:hypothetical protein